MARTTIPAELVAINAIQGTLIADNAITAVHIATNAVSGTLVADNAITSTHIAQNNVTATQIAQNTITVTQMADSAIETAKINNDAVTQAKIADDAIGPDQLAANAVVSASIANGTIVEADMADNAVTLAKMASLARGSIIYGDSAGDPAALSIGSNGTVLKSDGTDVSWGAAGGTTINNNADNRIITGSGTANTLNGEANLTFNSSLVITKSEGAANSLNDQISLEHTSGTTGYHIKTIRAAANDNPDGIAFVENTTERMRIRGGNIGMGTTNPDAPLHIEATNASMLLSNSGRTQYWRIQNNESADAFTINASDVNERFRIDSSGSITAPTQPSFMCYPTSGAWTQPGGSAQITFGSESFDKGGNYNTSNGRFTAPVAGRYLFIMELAVNASTSALTYQGIGLRKNGSGSVYFGGWGQKNIGGSTNAYAKCSSTIILELSANDYVETYIELSGSHGLLGGTSGAHTRWSGQLLS